MVIGYNRTLCLLNLPLDDGRALRTTIGNHNFLDEFSLGIGLLVELCCLPRGFVLVLLRSSSRIGRFRTHRS